MKTEFEKMRSGELACIRDPEIQRSARRAKQLCTQLQNFCHFDEGYRELIGELIPGMPATAVAKRGAPRRTRPSPLSNVNPGHQPK